MEFQMRTLFTLFLLNLFSFHSFGSDLKYVNVFTSNDGLYPEYRIPSLITTNKGTMLAFCEGRQTLSDHAENDIVLNSSTDGGSSWGDLIIIHDSGADVLVNPTAVVLTSGKILLMYQHFPVGYHARAIPSQQVKMLQPGIAGFPISKTLITFSEDDGLTWSNPQDVTAGTKRPKKIISTASGPGRGIVLSHGKFKGRIIIPTNEGWWEGTE